MTCFSAVLSQHNGRLVDVQSATAENRRGKKKKERKKKPQQQNIMAVLLGGHKNAELLYGHLVSL